VWCEKNILECPKAGEVIGDYSVIRHHLLLELSLGEEAFDWIPDQ
jgi:hypothetical protein